MFDLVRRYVDSVAGAAELPRERAERIVRDLAARGEVRARDIGKSARELARRSEKNRQELVRLVRKEIDRQVHALGLATRADLDRLARRVRSLEKKKGSSGSKPAAKRTAARKH